MFWLAQTGTEAQQAVEWASNLSGPAVIVLVGALLWRGTLMLGRHHADVVAQYETRLHDVADDRDWWKEASVTTLRIGESLVRNEEER